MSRYSSIRNLELNKIYSDRVSIFVLTVFLFQLGKGHNFFEISMSEVYKVGIVSFYKNIFLNN